MRNRANASDHGTFVEAIATHDAASAFRHHAVKARTGKQHRKQAGGGLRSGKIARKAVLRTEFGEGFVSNLTADGAVIRRGGTNHHLRL